MPPATSITTLEEAAALEDGVLEVGVEGLAVARGHEAHEAGVAETPARHARETRPDGRSAEQGCQDADHGTNVDFFWSFSMENFPHSASAPHP